MLAYPSEAMAPDRVRSGAAAILDLRALAPRGHHLALRVAFAFPAAEETRLPPAWVEHYARSGFMLFDPVIRWSYTAQGRVRWSALGDADERGVLLAAAAHGLRFGAAVSILDRDDGQRSFGSFARGDREFTDAELRALEAHLRARHDALRPPTNLTAAELETLRLVKAGQRLKQIAHALGVTEGAVKQRLKSARLKLAAKTGAEAISRAATFGLV